MGLPTPQSPTHAPARITAARFKALLKTKSSPAVPESDAVFAVLVKQGVDPSFALAQFRVESQYGTAGHAKVTGSWGNMLSDPHLTLLESGEYSPGNGYTYATYDNYVDAITDYCRYLDWYRDQYHLSTIYSATARWIGKDPGTAGHESYVTIICNDMILYEYPEGTFYESGDEMIYTQGAIKVDRIIKRYPITPGIALYRGTDGVLLKKFSGTAGDALWLGLVNGAKNWGMIMIKTSNADETGTLVYIKNPDVSKIKVVH
jgi:hypothetical protein